MTDDDTDEPDLFSSPQDFLQKVPELQEGWSQPYGGPQAVAEKMVEFQQLLAVQSDQIAAVRASAINELLRTHSGAEVARLFGISRQVVKKVSLQNKWKDARW